MSSLPTTVDRFEALRTDLAAVGFYPQALAHAVEVALAGENVIDFVVVDEASLDTDAVRRHVTVLVRTATRLLVSHSDDHHGDGMSHSMSVATTTECIPLHRIRSVMFCHLTRVNETDPSGPHGVDLTLTISWGSVNRVSMQPALCPDSECTADHGYQGTVMSEDIVVEVQQGRRGPEVVARATRFAQQLSLLTSHALPGDDLR